jgi:serine/threonine-protein kinase RsbW
MSEIRLQIPAHADYMDIVRLSLYGVATHIGFSFEDIDDMKVAITEACSNAVLHANTTKDLGTIDISFTLEQDSLSILVKDSGNGFDYRQALDDAKSLNIGEVADLRTGGMGLFLIQALMDEVDIRTNQGTEVSMKKYVTAKNPLSGD